MKNIFKKLVRKKVDEKPIEGQRVTNDSLDETRKEVLKGARKYIYPIQHSKHRVVTLSGLIGAVVLLVFLGFSVLSLYVFKSTSTFVYRITQVMPFPVARAGGDFVSYEDYLFEIRQYIHYFETQEKINFSDQEGVQQLEAQRKIALQKVIDQAYVRRIAKEKKITVSDEDVDYEIELLKSQNRLGSNQEALQKIISDYYGWTIRDFRRSLSDRILFTKVLEALDEETTTRANEALGELEEGADFAKIAAKYSDDESTKDNGGEIGFLIDKVDRNVPAQMTSALYALNPGEISGLVNVGYGLEIIKNLENKDGKIRAAYILFKFEDMQVFLNTEKEQRKTTSFLKL